MGAQNIEARQAASIGELQEPVASDFQAVQDVPRGGVLFALPALLATGLLKTSGNFFKLSKGYYGLDSFRAPDPVINISYTINWLLFLAQILC